MQANSARTNLIGALCAIGAMFCFSLNDVAIKLLSDAYPLHEVVLVRTLIGMAVFFALIMPFSGGLRCLRTKRLKMHLVRGFCVVLANTFFFMGLAAMPIADAVAIFFISPLVITVFSVIFLGENVGPRRWSAVALGLIGVMFIVRPGTSTFQLVSLLPMLAAVCYATLNVLTRKLGVTESAATLTFYIQVTFLFVSAMVGLGLGDGRFDTGSNVSLTFLLREWQSPAVADYWLLIVIGVASAFGGLLISQAYRQNEAGFVAPFEYVAMLMAVFWGVVIFAQWPDRFTWVGIAMILGSGLFIVWRDTVTGAAPRARAAKYRQ